MALWINRVCMACEQEYRVWWFQDPVMKLHLCSDQCRKALNKGFDLGLRASGQYTRRAK